MAEMRAALPKDWRIAAVRRAELDRFLFGPEDLVVAVGQDGLVANVAKYLSGQPIIGVNPDPARNPGILVPHRPADIGAMLALHTAGKLATESRTMVQAELDDGQRLLALNEVFVGHASHQSARYTIAHAGRQEAQSSSGVIVATGTGATGWALSISRATGVAIDLRPDDKAAVFLAREPWPSIATGVGIASGRIAAGDILLLVSRMNEGGVVFADGMEQDRLPFGWGAALSVQVAEQRLRLVPSERVRSTVVRPPSPPRLPVARPSPPPVPRPRPVAPAKPAGSYAPLLWLVAPLLWLVMVMTGVVGAGAAMLLAQAVGDFGSLQPVVFWPDGLDTLALLALPLTFAWHRLRRRSLTALRFAHRCHRACRRLGCGRERMADSAVHRRRLRALRGAGPPSRRGVRASRRLPMTPSGRRQQRAGHVHQAGIVGWASAHPVSHGAASGGLKPTRRRDCVTRLGSFHGTHSRLADDLQSGLPPVTCRIVRRGTVIRHQRASEFDGGGDQQPVGRHRERAKFDSRHARTEARQVSRHGIDRNHCRHGDDPTPVIMTVMICMRRLPWMSKT